LKITHVWPFGHFRAPTCANWQSQLQDNNYNMCSANFTTETVQPTGIIFII